MFYKGDYHWTRSRSAYSIFRMKKPKNSSRKIVVKRKALPKNFDEYLVAVPQPARSALSQVRAAIRSIVPPDATETISYGIPAFKQKKIVVWYAAFSDHCSLFPSAAIIEAFSEELQRILHIQRNHPFSHRQAGPCGANRETGQSPRRTTRKKAPVTLTRLHFISARC